jgi:hypothetical protein
VFASVCEVSDEAVSDPHEVVSTPEVLVIDGVSVAHAKNNI